jgi:hypothetical protein
MFLITTSGPVKKLDNQITLRYNRYRKKNKFIRLGRGMPLPLKQKGG